MLEVWNHTDPEHHPADGNFDVAPTFNLAIMGFPKKEITKFGLKRSVIFYASYDESTDTYQTPLLSVTWQTKFENLLPKYQIKLRSWNDEDGFFEQPTVSKQPIRNPKVFLQKMRSRVIEELIDLATQFGLEKQIKALYEAHPTEIYIYKEGGSPKFRDAIKTSTEEWLTRDSTDGRTVRDVIVQYLSIGVVESEAN